jgi:pSer/pThr/pTyr-binding forkhead associated (FHA) protein
MVEHGLGSSRSDRPVGFALQRKGELSVFCTVCGTENSPGDRFCSQCGSPLGPESSASPSGPDATSVFAATPGSPTPPAPDADSDFSTEAHQRAVDALTPGSALLVVKRGPNAGSRFLLDQDVTTAGRHPESDIFLDDVTVSRRHVEFRRDGLGFAVYDVGSLNGTYVNRERIDSAALAGGDEVQIGKFRLVYLTAAGATQTGGVL